MMEVLVPIIGIIVVLGVMLEIVLEQGERELRALETRFELAEAWERDEMFAQLAYESNRLRDQA